MRTTHMLAGIAAASLTLVGLGLTSAAYADEPAPETVAAVEPITVESPATEVVDPVAPEAAPAVTVVAEATVAAKVAPVVQTQTKLAICHSGSGAHWTYIAPDAQGYNGHKHHELDIYGLTEAECLAKNPPPVEEFTPYGTSASWLIPASWPSAQTPTYQAAIFPQDRTESAPPCGRWVQADQYWIENAADETVWLSLGDVLTQGEDSSIYASHQFIYGGDCPTEPVIEHHDESACVSITEYRTHTWTTTDGVISDEIDTTTTLTRAEAIELGCYTPPVVECEPGTVPGWLNEHGDATSCVSNNPCPEVEAGQPCPGDEPPVVTPPTTPVIPTSHDTLPGTLAFTGGEIQWGVIGGSVVAIALGLLVLGWNVRRRA